MITSVPSIMVTGAALIPLDSKSSLAGASVSRSWCSKWTPLDDRNSSRVLQLNQPGLVYTCTSIIRRSFCKVSVVKFVVGS